MGLQKGKRTQIRIRKALFGPPGSGKTLTAMKLMTYLCPDRPWAIIDTENDSALRYAPLPGEEAQPENPTAPSFDFFHVPLYSFDPRNYIEALKDVVAEGCGGVIIDSLSHAWAGKDGLLEQKNRLDKKGGNSYTNWGEITPIQNNLLDAILAAPLHAIVTMRSKADVVLETNERGKVVPRRVGTTVIQRDDVEYEFDIVGLMDNESHTMTITKSRCFDLPVNSQWEKPGAEVAQILLNWANTGVKAPLTKAEFIALMNSAGYKTNSEIAAFTKQFPDYNGTDRYDRLWEEAQKAKTQG